MAVFTPIAVLQTQADFTRDNIDSVAITKGLLRTDTYSQARGKIVAEDTYTNSDVTISTVGNDVSMEFAARTGIDPSDSALATEDLTMVVFDTDNQRILAAVDANNRVIPNESGDTVSWNAFTYFIRDSTSV